jgi:hypothetical protein
MRPNQAAAPPLHPRGGTAHVLGGTHDEDDTGIEPHNRTGEDTTMTTTSEIKRRTRKQTREVVSLSTCAEEFRYHPSGLREAGGIYPTTFKRTPPDFRELAPGEPIAACPRCGWRFAATEDGTAETHRDLHFHGDEECPSICAPAGEAQ